VQESSTGISLPEKTTASKETKANGKEKELQ
jgi:hypothetical protein